MRTSLFWYTKDLRVDDLPGLAEASARSQAVVPVYVFDKEYLEDEADNRKAFLLDSLSELDEALRKLGSGLTLKIGETARTLINLCRVYGATDIYCSESRDPQTKSLHQVVGKALKTAGLSLHLSAPNFLVDLEAVKTKTGGVYRVFTPYKNAVLASLELPKKSALPKNLIKVNSEITLPSTALAPSPQRQLGGTSQAKKLWSAFKKHGLEHYQTSRNDLANEQGTSRLSAHLNFGTISVRSVTDELIGMEDAEIKTGRDSFLTELLWREFNSYIAHHFPQVLHRAFREELATMRWQGNPKHLEAWKEGMTGYPVVDAAMRQLKQTGWMHNRARMIVASFLVKDLLINWQEGEAHFMEWLTDGDQIQNNAGWQWSASTGVDAQPYFRIFNPTTQGKNFDAMGEYVKRYVTELAHRPVKSIHMIDQNDLTYPNAIVDHAKQRDRALEMFKTAMTNFRK